MSKGRVVLLGDAGYSATLGGMETGLAIVRAYVLAGELAAAKGNHSLAFTRYEEEFATMRRDVKKEDAGDWFVFCTIYINKASNK